MATEKMDAMALVGKYLAEDSGGVMGALLKKTVEELMGAEADGRCMASYRERSEDRSNYRNGYRDRPWDTRVGTLQLEIPKLRHGSYFPEWLLERRKRSEQALYAVVAQSYVLGVSTRRVDDLVKAMGIDGISKSQVSVIAERLDQMIEDFRGRRLDGSYPYVWIDALYHKCREGGRVVSVATVVAVGVNAEGYREVLGLDVFTGEDGASWTAFLRGLVARGLSGVRLVVSDAHEGLKNAISAVFTGASWQRCRTHFMRNVLTQVSKSAQDEVATKVRSIFMQADAEAVRTQHGRVVDELTETHPRVAEMLVEAMEEILAFAPFPKEHWKQIWSNNPQERLNKEIRRRTDVVGIFPNREAIVRLTGALLAEQNDEWTVARRYMNPEALRAAQLRVVDGGQLGEAPCERKEASRQACA